LQSSSTKRVERKPLMQAELVYDHPTSGLAGETKSISKKKEWDDF